MPQGTKGGRWRPPGHGTQIHTDFNTGSRDSSALTDADMTVSVLTNLGATVIHNVGLLAEERCKATTKLQRMKLTRADFPSSMAAYLETPTTNPRELRTLHHLIYHPKTDLDEVYPNHKVASFEIPAAIDLGSHKFQDLEPTRDFVKGDGGLQAAMGKDQLDLPVTPTCSSIPGSIASLEGSPIISVPLGFYGPDKAIKKMANVTSSLSAREFRESTVFPNLPLSC